MLCTYIANSCSQVKCAFAAQVLKFAKEVYVATGQVIKETREAQGITQQSLAEKAGLSKGFLSDLENGNRGVSSENLLRIAKALSTTTDYLLGHEAISSAPVRASIEVPDELSEVAHREGWTYSETLEILDAYNTVVARRSSTKRPHFDEEQWKALYNAIRSMFNKD